MVVDSLEERGSWVLRAARDYKMSLIKPWVKPPRRLIISQSLSGHRQICEASNDDRAR